jgi:hypothetical protein
MKTALAKACPAKACGHTVDNEGFMPKGVSCNFTYLAIFRYKLDHVTPTFRGS